MMKFRTWLSAVTIILLGIVVFFAWEEIVEAFRSLAQVNLWILALLIPVQFLSYYGTGELLFSYLRAKGQIKNLNVLATTRLALEFNFVNHVFPSGGTAGIAYFSWQLGKHGVRAGRSTMAQIVRFGLTFISFVLLLLVALAILIIDHAVSREVLLLSLVLVVLAIAGTIGGIYLLSSQRRLHAFSGWATRVTNTFVHWITRGKKRNVLQAEVLDDFFTDIHKDYVEIRKDARILWKPFLWSVFSNICDVLLIYIAFWSFGVHINPAVLFIAFGLSSIGSAIAVTPGGAGVYEAIMVAFLSSAGVPPHIAIAGTLLARVVLLAATIVFGYIFYQLTVLKHGTSPIKRQ